jgi:hypothetical protein
MLAQTTEFSIKLASWWVKLLSKYLLHFNLLRNKRLTLKNQSFWKIPVLVSINQLK